MATSESVLRGATLFAEASAGTLRHLAVLARTSAHRTGDVVFRKGEPARDLILIRKGIVQIVKPGPEPTTLGIFGPREPIGLSAMLDGASFPADAVAACDVEVVRIAAAPVFEAMETDGGLLRSLNRALLAHTRALQAKIDMLTAGAVSARLAMLLGHLADRFGDDDGSGTTFVPVALSRGDLARLVGARPETVIRIMSRWQKERLLETGPTGFRLFDRSGLR